MVDKRISPVFRNKMDFVDENLSKGDDLILDVGCGEGHYFHIYKDKGLKFKAIDYDNDIAKRNKLVTHGDVQDLPFKRSTFKTVICIDVLEHVDDDIKAIDEIYRVLKNDGKLIVSVPNKKFPFVYDPINSYLGLFNLHLPIGLWAWGHKRLYTYKEIIKLLEKRFNIKKYEKRSHFFVGLTVNYFPYILAYLVVPIMKLLGLKKSSRYKVKKNIKKNIFYKFYTKINNLDKKYFSNTRNINHCFVCYKR